MKRVAVAPRRNWIRRVEELGFNFHTSNTGAPDPTYWDERVAYRFSLAQIEQIEEASQNLYQMCISAVEHVIRNKQYHRLGISSEFADLVKKSWDRQDLDLYGRFDLALDDKGTPKMLEFNADTPTSLYEAAVIQWFWLEDQIAAGNKGWDQYNSMHDQLKEAFEAIREKYMVRGQKMHFASMAGPKEERLENWCAPEFEEDRTTVWYLQDVAEQAGIQTNYIAIEDIGWNGIAFTDLDERAITTIFKLYPWEHMVHEEFGKFILREPWDMIEPAWKMILSNKGILPILWELFPDHPNLLPSFTDSNKLGSTYVRKPLLSREGANVTIVRDGEEVAKTEGGYGKEGHIYQAYQPLKTFDGNVPVIGSWIVGGRACGMGIREDNQEVTTNQSRFVPHYFVD